MPLKPIDFDQLLAELAAAGVAVAALGSDGESVFTYDAHGQPAPLPAAASAVIAAHTPSTALRDTIVALAQSSVGVTLGNLTQAQRLALVAVLLYRAGGVDPRTLAVRPLAQWALPPSPPLPPIA